MRYSFGFASLTHLVTTYLIIIIASYLFFALADQTLFGSSVYNALLLDPKAVAKSFEVWRLFTYALLHDTQSPIHVIFNALLLYMIGPQIENRWGEKRFLIFSLVAIILGGLLVTISFLLGLSYAPVVGFSAVTIGLIIAWGLTFSTHNIYIFGILPLTGKQLVYVTVGLEILYAVSANNISSAAHLGGIIAGFIFTLGLYKPERLRQAIRQLKAKRNLRHWR